MIEEIIIVYEIR